MTIKQQGGIFGRNPTFNTVTVDDKLGIGSEADVALKVSNGLSGYTWTPNARTAAIIEGGFAGGTSFSIISKTATSSNIYLGDTDAENMGIIQQNHSTNTLSFGSAQALTTRLDGSGNFNLLSGNLVIGTSGKGIDFSATSGTGTSELFDDYEEGTWTPFLRGDSGSGTVSYTTQTGYYTKIGNVVTVTFEMVIDTVTVTPPGGSSGLGGLPFTSVHTMSDGPVEFSGMSGTFSTISIRPTSFAYIRGVAGAAQTSYAAVAPTQFLSGTAIRGKLTFITA